MNPDQPHPHAAAREFFDKIAENYSARSKTAVHNVSSLSFSRRQDIVTRLMLMTPKSGTVLDYGMGPAVFGPPAVQNGLRYIGVDISPKMVELARQMNLPNSEFHVGDLNLLDRFVTSADTMLMIGLIDYLEQPEIGLRKLARCVKPGGRLILCISQPPFRAACAAQHCQERLANSTFVQTTARHRFRSARAGKFLCARP